MSLAALMARVDTVSFYRVGDVYTLTVTRGAQSYSHTFTLEEGEELAGDILYGRIPNAWRNSIAREAD